MKEKSRLNCDVTIAQSTFIQPHAFSSTYMYALDMYLVSACSVSVQYHSDCEHSFAID